MRPPRAGGSVACEPQHEKEGLLRGLVPKLLALSAALVVGATVGKAAVATIAASKTGGSERPQLLPFTKRHDGIELTSKQKHDLEEGKKVMLAKREMSAGGGRGTAVCDVAAPPKFVWDTVLDFAHYEGRLAACKRSTVYYRKTNVMQRSETIKCHMILDAVVKEFNCYYDHTWRPDQQVLTWTLDPSRHSDFVDVQGQWCVDKHPSKENWSRVWYSADIAVPPWLPRLVVVQMCKTSGIKALNFAKAGAESAFAKAPSKARWSLGNKLPDVRRRLQQQYAEMPPAGG
mmetsp:Transcript_1025/g.2933  ORF Transcript_1025/g.2933 Transcript_1025/m.2933 type:complete len:288 (-) Transcript_1025:310-1173(-)